MRLLAAVLGWVWNFVGATCALALVACGSQPDAVAHETRFDPEAAGIGRDDGNGEGRGDIPEADDPSSGGAGTTGASPGGGSGSAGGSGGTNNGGAPSAPPAASGGGGNGGSATGGTTSAGASTGGVSSGGASSGGGTGAGASGGTGGVSSGASGGTGGASSGGASSGGGTGAGASGGTGGVSTASCPRVKVAVPANEALNVRPSPSTAQSPIGVLSSGAIVDVLQIVTGQVVDGTATWYQIQSSSLIGYVSGAWVNCTSEQPPKPPSGYFVPLQCGVSAPITQGPNGSVSHTGQSYWAFDLAVPLNTPIVAMAAGTVTHIYKDTLPGHACYNGGGSSCAPYGNRISMTHGDGYASYYTHLNKVLVSVGQQVQRGQLIGLSGSTGWSTGPHLHVAKTEACGSAKCQSVKLTFADAGHPANGSTITSKNCL